MTEIRICEKFEFYNFLTVFVNYTKNTNQIKHGLDTIFLEHTII